MSVFVLVPVRTNITILPFQTIIQEQVSTTKIKKGNKKIIQFSMRRPNRLICFFKAEKKRTLVFLEASTMSLHSKKEKI